MLERSRDLVNGRCNEEIYAPELADVLTQGDADALRAAELVELPVQRVEMPDATPRWILFRKIALRDRDGVPNHILEFGEDLTERENAERRVASLNRILTVLSEINHLIIHTRDRTALLEQARLVMQEKGGFRAVWIHVAQGDRPEFFVDAEVRAFAEAILREIENPARRCWPKRQLHCATLECCNADLSAELRCRGLQSLIHLPLVSGDVHWGDIGILGAVDKRFTDEEQSLLDELAGNLSFALDALHLEEARLAAERTLELSARVFENNSEGIVITDDANRIVMINKAFTTVTGYNADEVIGKTPALLNSGRHPPEFFAQMWHTLQEAGEWRGEVINRRKNGEDFPEWLTISQVRDDENRVTNYVAVFSDLTGRRRIEASLDFLAHYDPLTSLPNRDYFGTRLAQAVKEAHEQNRRVAVMYLDLDRFKLVNEIVGQAAGDKLLVEVSTRLLAEADSKMDVARLGGDQFAVLLPGVESVAQATQAVLRYQDRLCQPYLHVIDHDIHVSASIGISVYPDDGADAETLARNADSAMYKAIEEGGNTYRFFREDMHQDAAARVQLESKLHHALERGELSVHFQPFVSGASGRVVGAEALLRWHCPELGGQVSPATFIPLLEEIGLIRQVGEWVLHKACAEVRRWQTMTGEKLFVAVNISALQLTADLPQLIADAIAAHGISPDQLEIELTESAIMRDADHGVRLLDEMNALGIPISIDDFGTGYSSLSYLKRLPASTLKIDRSFVLDIHGDVEAVSITRAILALGHSLRLNIVAEGVETEDQVEFLCHNGCDLLQGHYFSKAIDAEAFLCLLTDSPVFALPTVSPRPFQLLRSNRLQA
jgi:diguanylate cyclase (GGDEF)-like protein/PAS domain S-box-containing protein